MYYSAEVDSQFSRGRLLRKVGWISSYSGGRP